MDIRSFCLVFLSSVLLTLTVAQATRRYYQMFVGIDKEMPDLFCGHDVEASRHASEWATCVHDE